MFESIYVSILIAGFGGGAVRGLVGFIKHQYSYKSVPFKLPYFLGMMFISGIVGVLSAMTIKELGLTFFGLPQLTPALAFVIGYAGGDFLENVYKTIIKKPSLYSFPGDLIKK
ncbi:MAG: hypothetical protein G01um101417_96 [Parcubacteria group bacterium Gr01-1014_17]|nr:MAG: hypothetical protein G01um101417_96 [Parcubacteria group bacterium Gr01-1014_17]